jgi:hypothetical protein
VSGEKDALVNDDRQEQQDSFASHVVVYERQWRGTFPTGSSGSDSRWNRVSGLRNRVRHG